jgi:hypothetical protein
MDIIIITRQEAREAALPRFYTGQRCQRGHLCERSVRRGECIECIRERKRAGYAANAKQINERGVVKRGGETALADYRERKRVFALRRAAQVAGAKRFSTGQPCEQGHTCDRFTSDNKCVECVNGRARMAPAHVRERKRTRNRNNYRETHPGVAERKALSAQDRALRETAQSAGLSIYVSIRPCKRGHVGERYINKSGGSQCVVCSQIDGHTHYAANRDTIQADFRQRYATDPDLRQKISEAGRAYRAKNAEGYRFSKKQQSYGVDRERYNAMLAGQHGCCAICGCDLSTLPPKKVHIDHVHETGTVRGILCHNCNTGIGHLKDNPALFERAADYLIEHRAREEAMP